MVLVPFYGPLETIQLLSCKTFSGNGNIWGDRLKWVTLYIHNIIIKRCIYDILITSYM
ncbi:hypothetical protein ALC60_10891 [Trachymyrmex zeteki]|uniref:Uncharacterized protein n=1 Tax=Mycetomoellerius zeteki TaxID=64791 RepID=A0A151WQQ2_9HYME|nr:hypothetical protein ALC60_10891 [Trachymyrmex zeteki]